MKEGEAVNDITYTRVALSAMERVHNLLQAASTVYRVIKHDPTYTSEQSAAARGESIDIGAKALLIKADDKFVLVVLSAGRKLDSGKLNRHLCVKRTRFATKEELFQLTELVPGSLPPFGRPVFDFDLHADWSVLPQARIAFNAGSLTESVIMSTNDYARLAKPTFGEFSRPNETNAAS